MRKAFIAAAVLGTLASALPAAAQSYGQPYGDRYDQRGGYGYDRGRGYGQQPSQRVWQLRRAIDRLVQQGRLDRREALYFRRSADQLTQLDQRYRYNGYSYAERRDIDQRSDALMRALRQASERGYGNGYRYGNDGRYDRRDYDRHDYDRGNQRDDDDDDDDDDDYRR